MRPRVLLIGGTSEARAIAAALQKAGVDVLVSTLTEYGAQLASADARVRSGELEAEEMGELAEGFLAIVDASHPFAVEVTAAARSAAATSGARYVRFQRPEFVSDPDVTICATAEEAASAAAAAAGEGGTVLLTVGSRTLGAYAAACRDAGVRCVARVLPVAESLEAAEAAGLPPADVIAMQGPTSAALDEALLRHIGANVLVTKESGAAGGVPEKLEAARRAGARAVLVQRPGSSDDTSARTIGEVLEQVLDEWKEEVVPKPLAADVREGLVHVNTGDGKGKTTASVGLAVRAVGAGYKVAFVQFVKGGPESSELKVLRRIGVDVTRPATRSSGLMRGEAHDGDVSAAAAALDAAAAALAGDYDLVVLDEACVAARSGLVDTEALIARVQGRAPHVEVVLTGRGAPPEIVEIADYVTEMRTVRHPYERGTGARKGVEF
jgi:precorrin-6x reductase/cob(I)alamin adenosyltransferase